MKTVSPPEAHGSRLVDLRVDAERAALLKQVAMDLPDVVLNERHMCDFELLATGAFSPLTGFMVRADHAPVCDRMRLADGTLWPIPICLDVSEARTRRLEVGQSVALRDPEGFLLGVMHLADIWPAAVEEEARAVYGTLDRSHPGVDYLLHRDGSFYLGGPVEAISLPIHYDFKQIRQTPADVRALYQRLGWQRVVGFTTRNPVHRLQYELTLAAMGQARANLLLLPFVGVARPEDIDHYTRVRCYHEALRHYPPDTAMLNLLPLAVRMAGPRNALLHAIIARNFGCTLIEVHVSTPLAVCEQRDRKGMYAKARAGLIKGFTGVDDPYEAPERPELRIDTDQLTPDEAAQQVLVHLGQRGFL